MLDPGKSGQGGEKSAASPNDEKPSDRFEPITHDGSRLYMLPELGALRDVVTNDAVHSFIVEIRGQLDAGFGFVPLIGAGLSVPSGAPVLWDLHSYLQRCIVLALGIEERGMRSWNPRTDQ